MGNRIQEFLDQEDLPKPSGVDGTPLPASVVLPDPVIVQELAGMLHRKTFTVVKVLMAADIFAGPSHALDFATARLVCDHFGVAAARAGGA